MSASATALGWQDRAACLDLPGDDFFPLAAPGTDAYEAQAATAIATCGTCPVRRPCRDYAVSTRQAWGVWGGTTPDERNAALPSLTSGAA